MCRRQTLPQLLYAAVVVSKNQSELRALKFTIGPQARCDTDLLRELLRLPPMHRYILNARDADTEVFMIAGTHHAPGVIGQQGTQLPRETRHAIRVDQFNRQCAGLRGPE
jgi:hypothetical protein